jgi:hypothetical protein
MLSKALCSANESYCVAVLLNVKKNEKRRFEKDFWIPP